MPNVLQPGAALSTQTFLWNESLSMAGDGRREVITHHHMLSHVISVQLHLLVLHQDFVEVSFCYLKVENQAL